MIAVDQQAVNAEDDENPPTKAQGSSAAARVVSVPGMVALMAGPRKLLDWLATARPPSTGGTSPVVTQAHACGAVRKTRYCARAIGATGQRTAPRIVLDILHHHANAAGACAQRQRVLLARLVDDLMV